ncbi:hypothetical protein [Methylotuvimicrobium sp. KM1]|uniref:hypothetical protein n=1 Tax=Methylotuvimicrobium sp. KM1 TaxID=3377707 RepID=UPI003850096A
MSIEDRREHVPVGLTAAIDANDGINADFVLHHGWRVLGQCRNKGFASLELAKSIYSKAFKASFDGHPGAELKK